MLNVFELFPILFILFFYNFDRAIDVILSGFVSFLFLSVLLDFFLSFFSCSIADVFDFGKIMVIYADVVVQDDS